MRAGASADKDTGVAPTAPAPSAADIEARRQYAACIRSKGVYKDFPDPDPQTGNFVMDGDLGQKINPATAGAMQPACQDKLPGSTGGE